MESDPTPPGRKIVPAPLLKREVGPDEVWVEIDGVVLPELDPGLKARFDRMDAITEGMSPDEILAALPYMYHDADGLLRIRRQQKRAVPDDV
jgi:hypothetical protein